MIINVIALLWLMWKLQQPFMFDTIPGNSSPLPWKCMYIISMKANGFDTSHMHTWMVTICEFCHFVKLWWQCAWQCHLLMSWWWTWFWRVYESGTSCVNRIRSLKISLFKNISAKWESENIFIVKIYPDNPIFLIILCIWGKANFLLKILELQYTQICEFVCLNLLQLKTPSFTKIQDVWM